MSELKINSLVKLHTLSLLNDGPKHGYELIKELEDRTNQSISASHVYPFLKSLEEKNFIQCESVNKRDRKTYGLTEDGKEFVELTMNKLNSIITSIIENKLSTCTHCNRKVHGDSHIEIINGTEKSFCCQHCARDFKARLILRH